MKGHIDVCNSYFQQGIYEYYSQKFQNLELHDIEFELLAIPKRLQRLKCFCHSSHRTLIQFLMKEANR